MTETTSMNIKKIKSWHKDAVEKNSNLNNEFCYFARSVNGFTC